jgi:hypothetical protein
MICELERFCFRFHEDRMDAEGEFSCECYQFIMLYFATGIHHGTRTVSGT